VSQRLATLKLSYFRKHDIRCFVITTIDMWIRFTTHPSPLYCRYRKPFFLCSLPLSPFISPFLLKDLLIILMALFPLQNFMWHRTTGYFELWITVSVEGRNSGKFLRLVEYPIQSWRKCRKYRYTSAILDISMLTIILKTSRIKVWSNIAGC